MNYAGKFGSGTPDNFSRAGLAIDAPGHPGGGDSVTIPDAHLLFSGDYSRSGADLIISDQLHRVVVPNYFLGDKRPALLSPDGAPLDPNVIEAMTGHVQYAQAAGAAAAAKVVGHVVKMTGSASVVRNGVTVTLNNGDTVLQNDVVQTGSGSSLGLVMIDGTTFNLSANARLMLNDLTYEASSTSNASLFTLVQGAASFVAGQVAKTGDMKVGTPVATMGIRGTAVILDISAVDGKVSISVIDQRDGQVHSVQVYNSRGVLIGTVTSNGSTLTLTPIANFEVIAQESNKTVAQIQQEFNIFNEALRLYEIQKAIDPNLPQHTENNTANPRQYASLGSAAANSPQTVFHAPAGSGAPGQGPGGGTVTQIDFTPPGGTGQGGSSSPHADPIPLQVVVQSAQLPFVVNPSTIPQISTDPGNHFGPVMSASGDVVFDPDGVIYFYDRETNATIRVTPADDGLSYSGQTISSDGRYLVYQGTNGTDTFVYIYGTDPSDATHYHQQLQLAAGGSPAISGDGSTILVEHGGSSIGIYNLQGELQGTITAAAAGATGTVWKPAISADGHVMAFWTSDGATAGGAGHLFTYDVTTGTVTEIASTATDAGTSAASFSADGRYVTYQSDAPGGHSEIYLYDLSTGEVIFHTANVAGASYNPVISPDGHFIVFASDAHLVPGDTNAFTDIYTVDVNNPQNPVYKLISVRPDGTPGDADSNLGAAISAGGKFVVFATKASNFSNDPDGGDGDIFISDPSSGRNTIIYETASSPSILHAQGVIGLTGDRSGTLSISVSDNSGRFTAGFDSNGDIVWNFNEARSDFDSLAYGQDSSQQFVITLTAGGNTTTIPVNVTVHNGVQPVITVVDAAPGVMPVALAPGTEDTSCTITAAALLAGVGDIDTPLSLLSITDVSIKSGGGSIHNNENGTWTYIPAADFSGPVVFNYTVSDGSKTASSTASLAIAGVNDDATITGQRTGSVVEDGGTTASGALTVQDVDSGEAHFQPVSAAALHGVYGDFTFNAGTGEWTYALVHNRADSLAGGQIEHDTLTVTSADGTASRVICVTVTGSNDAPEFTGHGQATYAAGGVAVIVASDVFAGDIDSDNYDGGSFTATVTAGGHEGDTLSIADNAFISVVSIASGHVVMFDSDGDGDTGNAVAIGDLANNFNSLTVDLNGNVTDAAVQALAQAVQFDNGKESAVAGTRTVTFTLNDGGGTDNGGHDADFFEATVNVTAQNHPATFGGDFTGEVREDDTTVASGSTHGHDVDEGTLTVQDADSGEGYFQEVLSEDLLGDYGNFTFDHTTGEWTYSLVHERVNHLAEGEVQYDTLTVASVDGTTQDITVTVTGANEAPVFAATDLEYAFTPGNGAVWILGDVSVGDDDSDNYSGGSLSASVSGGDAGDRLLVGDGAYISVVEVASGHVVMFDADGDGYTDDAVAIGNLTGSGNSLTVSLNGNATDAAVNALAEAIRFENTNSYPEPGTRTVSFQLYDGHDYGYFGAAVDIDAPSSNNAPVAGNDNVNVRPDYLAIASSLLYNDSDPDEDTFAISGASFGESPAAYDDGAYTIQGQYGTMRFYATEHSSVDFGGFVDFHVNAGDFIYAIGQDINGDLLPGLSIYDLQPGQTLAEEFTYTITDSYGATSSNAIVTVMFEPSLVDLRVDTANGYDTTSLWSNLHGGIITAISSTHITVVNGVQTIEIDAKGLTWNGSVEEGDVSLNGGLIKGFHVFGPSGALFHATRYNLPAGTFDEAMGNSGPAVFNGMLAEYGYDSHGGAGADVMEGGHLIDYFDTGGGADTIFAGKGNDVITISDNAAWNIDGGDGIDTLRLFGAFDLTAGPEGQNAASIEIIDLNRTDANAIIVEPEGLYQINANHQVRILGNSNDNVVLSGFYPDHPEGGWVSVGTGVFYDGDSATAGVSFDTYEYRDGELTLATLYVEHGVAVDSGPVIRSNALQTVGNEIGGATISRLSILDSYTEGLTVTVVAGDGTLAPAGSISELDSFDDGSDGTMSAAGTLAAINQMLADGLVYTPDADTPPSNDMVTLTIDDGHDTDSLRFIFNVTGQNPTLFSTAGKDIIYATGGTDQFVFNATTGTGHDTIIDFTPGQDVIELDYNAFDPDLPNNFSAWLADHASVHGADVLIDLNVDDLHPHLDTILLKNVSLANLSANDFILPSGAGL